MKWTRLPDRKPLLVQAGDRLRLGDIEVQLCGEGAAAMNKNIVGILGFLVILTI